MRLFLCALATSPLLVGRQQHVEEHMEGGVLGHQQHAEERMEGGLINHKQALSFTGDLGREEKRGDSGLQLYCISEERW
ncbi:hypothetical protein GOP47_0029492 [Adiantum capillus-veneris]|nr:hypothetical protein GOP47_0029492 [Adiantum capillus-veneris]